MNRPEALAHLDGARSAVLATVSSDGRPHLVPIVFAREGDGLITAVDHKPKRTTELRRLVNIRHDSRVTVLVDHYSDDWDSLWWVRVDGTAHLMEPTDPGHDARVRPLRAKYPQYASVRLGTAITISIETIIGWSAA